MADFASPFRPGGPLMSVLGSSNNAGSAFLMNQQGDGSLMVFNRSAVTDAYLVYGPNSTLVATTILPVVGSIPPNAGGPNLLPMPARSLQSFTFSGPTFFNVIVAGVGNVIIDMVNGDGE